MWLSNQKDYYQLIMFGGGCSLHIPFHHCKADLKLHGFFLTKKIKSKPPSKPSQQLFVHAPCPFNFCSLKWLILHSKKNKKPSLLSPFSLHLLNLFISFNLSSTHSSRISVNDTGIFCPHAQISRLLVIIESDFWFCLKVSVITFAIVMQNYVSLTYI